MSALDAAGFSAAQATIQLLPFSIADFDPRAFSDAAMVCPATVARSVRSRQAGFFHGRICARLAMGQLGLAAQEIGIGTRGEPLWPAGMVGSITHTGCLAGAAVQFAHTAQGVGIDLEEVAGGATLRGTQDIFLSAAESALLDRAACGSARDLALVIAFSSKESFYKAVYPSVQRFFDFDAIEISGLDWERNALSFTVRQHLSHDFYSGRHGVAHFRLVHADSHVLTSFRW